MVISEERKKAFVVFASTYEAAVKHLTLEQMGELFLKMGRYSLKGEEVHSETPMVDVILKMTIPNMDAAERRHQAAIENGMKGKEGGGGIGRPRKGETREEYNARRLEHERARNYQSETPQKPLNKNININTDINTDKDIENNKDTDVNRNRDKNRNKDIKENINIEVIPDNDFSNISCSNSSNFEGEITKHGEEPRQGTSPEDQSLSVYSKMERDDTKCGAEPRQEESPRQRGCNGSNGMSDFLRSITLDDSYLEDDVPPCPPDPRFMNYAGNIQDFIRYDAEPDYEGMTDAEMMDAVKEAIDDAIECLTRRGKDQRYWDLMRRAKKIYMHLNGCSEKDAESGINRLYKQRQVVV